MKSESLFTGAGCTARRHRAACADRESLASEKAALFGRPESCVSHPAPFCMSNLSSCHGAIPSLPACIRMMLRPRSAGTQACIKKKRNKDGEVPPISSGVTFSQSRSSLKTGGKCCLMMLDRVQGKRNHISGCESCGSRTVFPSLLALVPVRLSVVTALRRWWSLSSVCERLSSVRCTMKGSQPTTN